VINKAFRIGKRSVKPRLLKISLSSDVEKATILKNCTKLMPHQFIRASSLHQTLLLKNKNITKNSEQN